MPAYDCGDPDCTSCAMAFRTPKQAAPKRVPMSEQEIAELIRRLDVLEGGECCRAMGGPGVHPRGCDDCPRDLATLARKAVSALAADAH